jgi:tRNA A-37 threonylcarbamoyl transferase component Bud32
MQPAELEKVLRDLPAHGTLVKDRGYRQVWRFTVGTKAYFLKFYPRHGWRDAFRRLFRGSPARMEFERLQWLQRAQIPAPRAVAAMMGFRLQGRIGDAVVLEAIEPSRELLDYLMEHDARGDAPPDYRRLSQQVRSLVHQLGRAKLGHEDLHLGNFLMHAGQLYLLDGYAVRKGGLKLADVQMLAHSSRRFCTTTDLVRGWEQLGPGGPPPRMNPLSRKLWRSFMPSIWKENRYFGRLHFNGWRGFYFKKFKQPVRWSPASKLEVSEKDWQRLLPMIFQQLESEQFYAVKRGPSGEVLRGEIVLGAMPLNVIIKRPRKKVWYRYLNEIGRGSRAHREWKKSWTAIVRGWPTAWPLLLLERRRFGYIVESMIVYERVMGRSLEKVPLADFTPQQRDMLMRRTGRLLRKIEEQGFSHFDAKGTNWMVRVDEKLGPMPIMIDIDGIRNRRWRLLGLKRLLRSMQDNPSYTPDDSLALCQGYAPYSRAIVREGEVPAEPDPPG